MSFVVPLSFVAVYLACQGLIALFRAARDMDDALVTVEAVDNPWWRESEDFANHADQTLDVVGDDWSRWEASLNQGHR